MIRLTLKLLLASVVPLSLQGQTLQRRIEIVERGTVRMSFAARPGVCGQGANNITVRDESDEWRADCDSQPVRVALRLLDHRVESLRTYVGGHWLANTQATDLGGVRPQEAAAYLIALAERGGDSLDGDPVLPATLADSVTIWPSLLRLARKTSLSSEARRTAVFWLGQAAATAAGVALDSIARDDHGDREVRKHAIFALSQRSHNEGVPALIRIARTSSDRELRRTALFWLGQSEDSRALALFEELLR